jgi:nitroreductase
VSLFAPQDVAAAAQNLLLTAHACGLGAVWVGACDVERVRAALSLEASLEPPLRFAPDRVFRDV